MRLVNVVVMLAVSAAIVSSAAAVMVSMPANSVAL